MTASLSVAILHDRKGGYLAECLERLMPTVGGSELIVLGKKCDRHLEGVPVTPFPPGTHGDLILLVSCMVMVERDCVRRLLELMESKPDAAAAGALLLSENGWPRRSSMSFPSLLSPFTRLGQRLSLLSAKRRRYGSLRLEQGGKRRVDALPAICIIVRRRAWEEIGEFAEGYRFRFDDIDWARRAAAKGWRLYLEPKAKAYCVAPTCKGPIPIGARLAYEESLRRYLRANEGAAFRWAFQTMRIAGATVACAIFGILALTTAFRSRVATERFCMNAAVLRLYITGRAETKPAPDAEETTRWEYATWRAE